MAQTGTVHGGQQPIAGAHIYLFAVSTVGSAPVSLLQGSGVTVDGAGNGYVTSDSNGDWNISGLYAAFCPSSTSLVYLMNVGGDPGLGYNNPAISLVSAMPVTCPNLPNVPSVAVNELTTVAAAWALAPFADVASDSFTANSSNLALLAPAFANANNLVSGLTGAVQTSAPAGNGSVPYTKINTMADVLAGCVNGGTSPCSSLFAAATPLGGLAPTDTLQTAMDVSLHSISNVSALFGLLPSPATASFSPVLAASPSDWSIFISYPLTTGYSRAITLAAPHADLTDFPVLVSGTYPFLATTANGGQARNGNGYDIVFTSDAAGQNLLDFEIDSYNPANGQASFWVRIPTFSHTSATTIYMFYGISGITTSEENKAGVWRNNYLSVYHLGNGSSVGLTDSASSAYTLASSGSPSAGAGKIGGGASFTGDPTSFLFHDPVAAYPSGTSPVTLEAWVQLPNSPGNVDVFGYGENSGLGSRAAISLGSIWGLDFEYVGYGSSLSVDNGWHHFVGVYGGGPIDAGNDQLYLDGSSVGTTVYPGTPAITTTELKIGGIPTVTNCCALNGSVDEVRVSSGVRSADWIATEYANQSSPSSFYSMAGPTGGPAGGVGNLFCTPSVLHSGDNSTCSVSMPAGATGQVTFSLDGQSNMTAITDSFGLVNALIDLASASVGNHTIAYSYPGDAINPAASGTTTVTIATAGTLLPGQSNVYLFSITNPDGSSGFAPNGNITGYFDSVNGMWSNITYDGLNRLISAMATPAITSFNSVNFCWAYDSFGNRTSQVQSNQSISGGGSYCSPQLPTGVVWTGVNTIYSSANQIADTTDPSSPTTHYGSPVIYNPSGGGAVTQDDIPGMSQHTYLYDAEGRICAVKLPPVITGGPNQMIQYLYDAEGNRIGKGTITQWGSCDPDASVFTLTNEYVLGQGGEQVTELDGNGNWLHTNAYVGGQLIATLDTAGGATLATPAVHYQLTDWLGTRRMQVSPTGQVEATFQSLPFGDQLTPSAGTNGDATEHHFTGKERDAESGNDYFGARYYASNMGRFMSPDDGSDQDPSDPQSWNLYGYVRNNPLKNTDPTGNACVGGKDDDRGGESCADVAAADAAYNQQGRASVTVTAQPSGGFDPGSFAAGVFGPQSASTWNNAAGTVNAAFKIETSVMAPWAAAAVDCMSGGSKAGCAANMALSVIPEIGGELRGLGLLAKEEKSIAGVLKQVASGTTKGKEFLNLGGSLPAQAAGYYREFTVPLAGQSGRGAARLVTGAAGEVFYTADHYVTFTRIK